MVFVFRFHSAIRQVIPRTAVITQQPIYMQHMNINQQLLFYNWHYDNDDIGKQPPPKATNVA
ncbi:hypothetical protein EP30_04335 [Bifidobacterium sp. UTCIF-39]|nr:hypothetical protein EP30_04335 [Bifidobacterium sp. UTCIF-39]